jgi:hypothetical protein
MSTTENAFVKHRSSVQSRLAAPLDSSSREETADELSAGSAGGAAEKQERGTDPVQGSLPYGGSPGRRGRGKSPRDVLVGDDHKVCRACARTLPLDSFYKNKGGLAGRQSKCKPCFVVEMRAAPGYRHRHSARNAVRNAIKAGSLTRSPTCETCGQTAYTHGHHDDYSKPLDVRWLCKPCHEDQHRGEKYRRREVAA